MTPAELAERIHPKGSYGPNVQHDSILALLTAARYEWQREAIIGADEEWRSLLAKRAEEENERHTIEGFLPNPPSEEFNRIKMIRDRLRDPLEMRGTMESAIRSAIYQLDELLSRLAHPPAPEAPASADEARELAKQIDAILHHGEGVEYTITLAEDYKRHEELVALLESALLARAPRAEYAEHWKKLAEGHLEASTEYKARAEAAEAERDRLKAIAKVSDKGYRDLMAYATRLHEENEALRKVTKPATYGHGPKCLCQYCALLRAKGETK
jgi:hypothetical protein